MASDSEIFPNHAQADDCMLQGLHCMDVCPFQQIHLPAEVHQAASCERGSEMTCRLTCSMQPSAEAQSRQILPFLPTQDCELYGSLARLARSPF